MAATTAATIDMRTRPFYYQRAQHANRFPSVPLAILRPDVSFTLIDSTAKKLEFVRRAAATLSLDNAEVVCARAEDIARDAEYRARYDVGVSRAVAALPTLAELTLPFLRTGGTGLCMKGPLKGALHEELRLGRAAMEVLGGEIVSVDEVGASPCSSSDDGETAGGGAEGDDDDDDDEEEEEEEEGEEGAKRTVVIIRKRHETPARFPRGVGVPKKRPIGTPGAARKKPR